jgi:hypothetical protein
MVDPTPEGRIERHRAEGGRHPRAQQDRARDEGEECSRVARMAHQAVRPRVDQALRGLHAHAQREPAAERGDRPCPEGEARAHRQEGTHAQRVEGKPRGPAEDELDERGRLAPIDGEHDLTERTAILR